MHPPQETVQNTGSTGHALPQKGAKGRTNQLIAATGERQQIPEAADLRIADIKPQSRWEIKDNTIIDFFTVNVSGPLPENEVRLGVSSPGEQATDGQAILPGAGVRGGQQQERLQEQPKHQHQQLHTVVQEDRSRKGPHDYQHEDSPLVRKTQTQEHYWGTEEAAGQTGPAV